MLRSLFSGISGLHVNQVMLDVTGSNIANANTIGYKSSTTIFSDTLSQMLSGATVSNVVQGGTNPVQVGLGVQVAATQTNLGQGSAQMTGRSTDLMLQGDGFFVTEKNGINQYTRAGSFSFDETGTLTTPTGARVQGYAWDDVTGDFSTTLGPIVLTTDPTLLSPAAVPDPVTGELPSLTSFNFGADGTLRGVYSDGVQRDIARLATAQFNNPMGLEKVGETSFIESANSGAPIVSTPGQDGSGTVIGGALEMSNVDLASEFTNLILAQRGFQASSRVITTSDSVLEELVNIKR
ncbi:flagellar hook-basal body complex protein [Nocardioides sp. GY 10127]|uniref:flagellar hook-basal body complex protein n=1 Tax=Nocardioides sp. GY 10127 TaxID=2569762 RepID=UPI0010A81186|nr:flagellar hook-basal body complex protein [Nocardioides sp. GY 10127]TIC78634.1 flagellar hook-basal body complex protein [Nocardioides sp. GY 10127]